MKTTGAWRCFDVEHLGGTRVRFTCQVCGSKRMKDYSKGPVSKRIGEAGVAFLVKSWANRGPSGICRRCTDLRK